MFRSDNKIFQQFKEIKYQILWGAVLVFSVYFIYHIINSADKTTSGFISYYTASHLLLEGGNVDQFYGDEWFSSKVNEIAPGIYELYYVNFPTTSLLMLPIANLSYKMARIVWTISNFILLVITIGFIISKFKFTKKLIPLIIILFLLFQPLYVNFSLAQVYILVFSLLIFTYYAYITDKQELSGVLIGLMFILKTFGIFFWILLLIDKKWKSLLWSFITVITITLISLPWIGISSWGTYLETLGKYFALPTLSVTAYQTIHSFFYHLFVFDSQWNSGPLFNAPVLGILFTMMFSVFLLGILIYFLIGQKNKKLSFGAVVILGVILSPASLDYHYLVLILPIMILIQWLLQNKSNRIWIFLILFYIFIAAKFPYTSPLLSEGWLSIFAYPKLYGALGLFVLFILGMRSNESKTKFIVEV
jgi:Glycosyltransferase family 87